MQHKLINYSESVEVKEKLKALLKSLEKYDVFSGSGELSKAVLTTACYEDNYFGLYYEKGSYNQISAKLIDIKNELFIEPRFGFSGFKIEKFDLGGGLSEKEISVQTAGRTHLGLALERRGNGIGSLLFLAKCYIESLHDLEQIVIFDNKTTIPYRYGFSPEKYYAKGVKGHELEYIKRDSNYSTVEVVAHLLKLLKSHPGLQFAPFREI